MPPEKGIAKGCLVLPLETGFVTPDLREINRTIRLQFSEPVSRIQSVGTTFTESLPSFPLYCAWLFVNMQVQGV